jgi:hypothetical protein
MTLEFLLTQWIRGGHGHALDMARETFAKMRAGGIHDQIGGGFHRYSVDTYWLVPHFEKMLYDNALLARFGAHLWQATGDDDTRAATEGILRWVAREMTSLEGGFYASLDADSEGHEGIFYTWTVAELDALLGDDARAVCAWFGVSDAGNFEGRNIPFLPGDLNVAAVRAGMDAGAVRAAVGRAIPVMYDARSKRVWPARDTKIIAAWNGLMLRGVAACARVFGGAEWRSLAIRNAEFLASHLLKDGRVFRIWARDEARINGFLEDYAAVALGFVDVWELTHDRAWLDRARELCESIVDRFWDDDAGGFYDVARDHEPLIARPRDLLDNATPSGSSLAVELCVRLAYITGDDALARRAERAIGPLVESIARYPNAFGHLLGALDMLVHGATAVAVVGDSDAATALLSEVNRKFLPSAIVAASEGQRDADLALFAGRDARGSGAAAYVCRGPVCDAPATTLDELRDRLVKATTPAPTNPRT